MARTLQRIAANPDDLYHGAMARELVDDLKKGVVLLSTLNILESYDLAKFGDRSPQWIHLISEAYRRAFMDRSEYLGDPDYNPDAGPRAYVEEICHRVARVYRFRQGQAQRRT